jgi:hypothetical protein
VLNQFPKWAEIGFVALQYTKFDEFILAYKLFWGSFQNITVVYKPKYCKTKQKRTENSIKLNR